MVVSENPISVNRRLPNTDRWFSPSLEGFPFSLLPNPPSRRVMQIVCLPVEEGGEGQIRTTKVTIEPDAQVQGCQLGGDAALQVPQAAGARKVQAKDLLQVPVDRLDDLPSASMGTASGAAANLRIVLGGQDRCTVIRQPMRLPQSAERPVVRHIGTCTHRPDTVPRPHRSRRSDIRPSTAPTWQLLRADGLLIQVLAPAHEGFGQPAVLGVRRGQRETRADAALRGYRNQQPAAATPDGRLSRTAFRAGSGCFPSSFSPHLFNLHRTS